MEQLLSIAQEQKVQTACFRLFTRLYTSFYYFDSVVTNSWNLLSSEFIFRSQLNRKPRKQVYNWYETWSLILWFFIFVWKYEVIIRRYAYVLNFLYINFFSKEKLNAEKDGSLHVSMERFGLDFVNLSKAEHFKPCPRLMLSVRESTTPLWDTEILSVSVGVFFFEVLK
jgi:hypothetical protein